MFNFLFHVFGNKICFVSLLLWFLHQKAYDEHVFKRNSGIIYETFIYGYKKLEHSCIPIRYMTKQLPNYPFAIMLFLAVQFIFIKLR